MDYSTVGNIVAPTLEMLAETLTECRLFRWNATNQVLLIENARTKMNRIRNALVAQTVQQANYLTLD